MTDEAWVKGEPKERKIEIACEKERMREATCRD